MSVVFRVRMMCVRERRGKGEGKERERVRERERGMKNAPRLLIKFANEKIIRKKIQIRKTWILN